MTANHSDCKVCIQKLENQIEASKEKMLFELETAKAAFEHKLRKMDRKMMHQAQCMDRLCQERVKAEATECLHRIDKRAIEERAHMAEENDAKLELVKDDLREWVEERLRDVQKQLKMLNEGGGGGLRVRSKSESDLGNIDSMEETEITDTDGEDIKGIVIGRGKSTHGQEDHISDDDVDGGKLDADEVSLEEKSEEDLDMSQGSPLQRRRPVTRSRNVRTGKYGRHQVTLGRSKSLDREIAMAKNVFREIENSDNSSPNDHDEDGSENVADNKHGNFKVPTYGSMPSEVKHQQETLDAPGRGRSAQRTTQSKRTSSFTRAVQHEMWAAAGLTTDSDGSGRSMVEGTYRPPIVVVNEPHRMGSYASGEGIQPANMSSADSDSETDTLSLTSSEDSLVTVSHVTINSSSGTLTSQHATPTHQAPVLQPNSRQPASGQSESSPSTSQSSSPGDAAVAAAKRNSDCSKSSSGISSAASNTFSRHNDPMDDIVVRASAMESRAPNRGQASRNRPSGSVDIPPPREFASNQYGYTQGQYTAAPQQYVTLRSAYSAQQQPNPAAASQQSRPTGQAGYPASSQQSTGQAGHPIPSQQGDVHARYPPPRQTTVVQPPAFRSSKPSVAGGAIFAARSSPSPIMKKRDHVTSHTHGQIPQEQKPVVKSSTAPMSQRYGHVHSYQPARTDQQSIQNYQQIQQISQQKSAPPQYQQIPGNEQRPVDAPQSQKPFHPSNTTSGFRDNANRFVQSANPSRQLAQQYQTQNSRTQSAFQSRPDVVVTPSVSSATPNLNNNRNSAKLAKPLVQQSAADNSSSQTGQASQTSMPTQQEGLAKPIIDNNGNSAASRPSAQPRPQTPKRVPPTASVPSTSNLSQNVQGTRPQSSGANDAPAHPKVSNSTGAAAVPGPRNTHPTGQRSTLVRRTYEITL